MAAGTGGGTINWDDLDFKQNYSFLYRRALLATYMDIMIEVSFVTFLSMLLLIKCSLAA